MAQITDDGAFRAALDGLPIADQRAVGAKFVESVLPLNDDGRVRRVVEAAASGAADTLDDAFHNARRASIDSHARCGSEGDWRAQAAYFVARAATAIVTPEGHGKTGNLAWEAAAASRMARTCSLIDDEADPGEREALRQYRILNDYLER